MRRSLILAGVIAAFSTGVAFPAPGRYPIGNAQIAASICSMGVPVRPGDVTLLAEVVATLPSPWLRIRSVERFDGDRIMVRMQCEDSRACLPFMVSLHADSNTADRLASISTFESMTPRYVLQSSKPVLIRNGSSAILLLDSEHVHIRIPV
ncbi:MAG: hypothetical protein LUO89_10170, partial [Methanothrix sp.]|nr:hypothetical protein [Methanothrix sp.]